MATSEPTQWQPVGEIADVYRRLGDDRGPVTTPVLLAAGADAGLDGWTMIGESLSRDGFRYVYACQLRAEAARETLAHAIDAALAEGGTPWLVLAAYGDAGTHALQYVEGNGGYQKARLLVGLGGQYRVNALSYLENSLLQRFDDAASGGSAAREETPPAAPYGMALVNQFVMINIYGQARTSILEEGTRNVLPLPEAINVGLHVHPSQVLQAPAVYTQLRQYLRNGFWAVQLHLTSFRMRKGAPGAPIGQFYFEVAGQRVPPDGVFAPPNQSTYVFEHFTPLGTVAFPPTKAAADVNFRLREVGLSAQKRRTLFTTLHVPLAHGNASDHVMQDSFGSEIRLRVHCIHMPQIIPVDHER